MNIYAFINGLNSLLAFSLIRILLGVPKKNKALLLYMAWLFLFFLWTFSYMIWGFRNDLSSSLIWLNILMYPVCLIHTVYFHFILTITEQIRKFRSTLFFFYLLSLVFLAINATSGFDDPGNIRQISYFRFWPHGNNYLPFLILSQIICILLSVYTLWSSIAKPSFSKRKKLYIYLWSSIIAWTGGLLNWIGWYDWAPYPSMANIAITFYLIVTGYLIFKYDVVGMEISLKKTFVYTASVIIVAGGYIALLLLFQRIFEPIYAYETIWVKFLSALIIAVLFIPTNLVGALEKIFYGKKIDDMSEENKLMQNELLKQDQMKAVATLAAGMAHEIKNPLTSIKTFTEYLPQKYDDPVFRDKFHRIVVDEVDRVNNIVKQMLDFSRPVDPVLQKIFLKDVIEETLALLQNNLISHKIEVTKNYISNDIVFGDKNQLKQVFLNILLNSIQAMPVGGKLTVATFQKNDRIEIQITDSGPGIDEKDINKIFDPFFTTKENGTGLGLSIAHGIIQKHGGKIKIKSEAGQGTTVSVTLKSRS